MKRSLSAVLVSVVASFGLAASVFGQCSQWSPSGGYITVPSGCFAGIGTPAPGSMLELYGQNPKLKITQISTAPGSALLTLTPAGNAGNVGGISLRGEQSNSPYIYNDSANSSLINFGDDLIQSHAKFVFDVSTGKISLGGANPTFKLEVVQSSSSTGFAADTGQFGFGLINNVLPPVTDSWSSIAFAQAGGGSVRASIGAQYRAGNNTDLVLGTSTGAGLTEKMRITGAGDVGISGSLNVSGDINARYGQDIAEWVPANDAIPTGTVVSLDKNHSNRVMPSSAAYDTSVAGVVSAKPGIVLGEGSSSKVLVATTGRVRVRVDATRHPIMIGDLLVTSDRAGTAMRSESIEFAGVTLHRPGTIIGKALEPIDHGQGEILVLLALQ